MTLLPDKLSDLIRLALCDLKEVERDPRYAVDMAVWHLSHPITGRCAVCLAGSVMAKTLGVPPARGVSPAWFFERVRARLEALDAVRTDDLQYALMEIGAVDQNRACALQHEWERAAFGVPSSGYKMNPETFKARLAAMAHFLERRGL